MLAGQLVESLASGMAPGLEAVKLAAVFGNDPFLARLYGEGVQQLSAAGPGRAPGGWRPIPYFEILLRNDPASPAGQGAAGRQRARAGANLPGGPPAWPSSCSRSRCRAA